jgi:hypothetical protein
VILVMCDFGAVCFNQVVNGEGTWVQLNKDTMRKFCFNMEGEAWSLALSRSDVVYLRKEGVMDGCNCVWQVT